MKKESTQYVYKKMKSPVGELTLVASPKGLAAVLWEKEKKGRVKIRPEKESKNDPMLLKAEKQLKEYFAGTRTKFALALDFQGTEFQKKVWKALLSIPFGKTASYGEIAKKIGLPKSSRAVGAANSRNPISLFAPCHRVVGTSGTLTGYAGGIGAKATLLALEGCDIKGKATSKTKIR